MDDTYFEADYIDFHYFNYKARAEADWQAFDLVQCAISVIHLMASLTYKIREETRLLDIRSETRLKGITEETRQYKIKEG